MNTPTVSASHAQAQRETIQAVGQEMARRAPRFVAPADWVIVPAIALAITTLYTSVIADLHFPFLPLVYWVAPLLVLFGLITLSNHRRKKMQDAYVAELLLRYPSTPDLSPEDRNAAAASAFNRRYSISTGISAILVLTILVGFFVAFDFAFENFTFQFWSFASWVDVLWRMLVFVAGLFNALITALLFAGAIRFQRVDYDKLLRATFGREADIMEEADRNDFDIIEADVDLKTMLRRVETYTLESTLLGALAFSAFVTIQFQDGVGFAPQEPFDWLSEVRFAQMHLAAFGRSASISIPLNVVDVIQAHIGPLIAMCLLACAVAFLAVLAARIQFTDAYRHAEGELEKAKCLNQKEEDWRKTDQARARRFTEQIARFLTDVQQAIRRVNPIVHFMRLFRNLGLGLFLSATIICGFYFSPWVPSLIILVFVCAYLFFTAYRAVAIRGLVNSLGNKIINLGGQQTDSAD